MTTAKDKRSEAARLAAASADRFREAAERERESRGAPTEERLRVLGETIEEDRQAMEAFGGAVEIQAQAIEERAPEPEAATK